MLIKISESFVFIKRLALQFIKMDRYKQSFDKAEKVKAFLKRHSENSLNRQLLDLSNVRFIATLS